MCELKSFSFSHHFGSGFKYFSATIIRKLSKILNLRYPEFFFYFTQLKPTDTWPRDRCGRAQLVLLPSLVDSLHLGADL